MAFVPILDIDNDVKPFFSLACCEADVGTLRLLRKFTEAQARAWAGHCISQNTITAEYQRREDIGSHESADTVELIGDKVYLSAPGVDGGNVLQLDNGFVRSISDLREDADAHFGLGGSDFAAGTALTSGTDFYLELDRSGLSRSGRVIRNNRNWSSTPGTIRITYVAGLTAAELDDEWAFVKLALLEDMQSKFNDMRSRRSDGGGPIKSRTFVGDYKEDYAVSVGGGGIGELSDGAKQKLQPIRRIAL